MADDIIDWKIQLKNSAPYIQIGKGKDKKVISEQVSSKLAEDHSGHLRLPPLILWEKNCEGKGDEFRNVIVLRI